MSIVLLRHASAGDRHAWVGDDALRPLDERGHAQALELRDRLVSRGVERVMSSPYVRCVETVAPLAAALGVAVESDDRLAEGADPAAARELLTNLAPGWVACTHGDVIVAVTGEMLKKGAAFVLDDELRPVEKLKAP
jgi:8-oxo-dGTP diphosphatase